MALPSSLAVAKRVATPRRLLLTAPHVSRRLFSENNSLAAKKTEEDVPQEAVSSSPQEFVKVKLEPGEWDDAKVDPIDRPPWKSNAKIISAEDFANRPQVGWGDEFESMKDAMVTLTWLDQKDTDAVYQAYLDMMGTMQQKEGVTSHEYVTRVIAQKFNLSARRVAAIVQLAHNEDQIRKEGGTIHYEIANEVDQQIKEHIRNAYEAYGEEPPKSFVEDPFGVGERGDLEKRVKTVSRVEDLYDVDDKMSQALVREQEEARLAIDSHVYIEDVDESLMDVSIDANCQKLLKSTKEEEAAFAERPGDLRPLPESGKAKDRFKFVAQIIDTRDEKKCKKKKKKKRRTDSVEGNTLVEQDGLLRVATVAEVKETSWKPERNTKEFTYAGVKEAWVDRTVHGKTGTWGRFEDKKEEETKEDDDKELAAADEEDSSSDSSSDDEDSSDSSDDEEDEQEEDSTKEDEEEDKKKD